jgi:hypothetical protein
MMEPAFKILAKMQRNANMNFFISDLLIEHIRAASYYGKKHLNDTGSIVPIW